MVVSQFSGNSLLHQGGSFEPQRKSNYAIVISGVPGLDRLTLYTKSLKIPSASLTKGKVKHFNETMHYAGSVAPFEGVMAVFHDYLDIAGGRHSLEMVSRWWKQTVCLKNGAIGFARDYKKQGEVFLLPPGMPNQACPGVVSAAPYKNRKFILQGAWISRFDYDELSMEDGGETPASFTLELSVDRAVPADFLT